jgi:mono/diheme cytochrome c family protein
MAVMLLAGMILLFSLPCVPDRASGAAPASAPLSEATQACIDCHQDLHPGLVADWRAGRHAKTAPGTALERAEGERRISAASVPPALRSVAVGCYECHSLNGSAHKDNFDHAGYRINIVVSPRDCETCHPTEVKEYSGSKKAHALANLESNPVFMCLVEAVDALKGSKGGKEAPIKASEATKDETCYACHGTQVEVTGRKTVSTDAGEMEFPELRNWPNQGVGRVNPDGSLGACTSCHPRHRFAIGVARRPYTCGQCHLEPDVPAFDVYHESKHGNIFSSSGGEWNFDNVPWVAGRDFFAPTCAVCHGSLLATTNGTPVAARTHDFGSRPWVRIFGLIYSHPQPKSGMTFLIRNKDGLPLPTAFSGEPAAPFLIDKDEQAARLDRMKGICRSCHTSGFTDGHFTKFAASVAEADRMVLAATLLLQGAWDAGLADKSNPFDEGIELKWVREWLFYANSVRFGSAMMGPDYATFKHGWWDLTDNIAEMTDLIRLKQDKGINCPCPSSPPTPR